MTRKHFQAIADTIANLPLSDSARAAVANDFADTCKGFNPNFKRETFLKACNVGH